MVKTGARINEIYKRIEKKTNLENEAEKISDKIRREIQHNLLNIVIIDWVKERLPTESEIELLTAMQYFPSDFIIPPLMNKNFPRIKNSNIESFIEVINKYYEIAERLNNKVKMGYMLIDSSQKATNTIIDFFYKKEVGGIIVDFNGKDPLNKYMQIGLLRHKLYELYTDEIPLVLYAINVNQGHEKINNEIKRASDIFLYEMGFNIIGDKHKQRPMPEEVIKKYKATKRNMGWIFNNTDYGYYKTELQREKEKYLENWKNFLIEGQTLMKVVKEEKNITYYLKGKKYAKEETINEINKMNEKIKQVKKELKQNPKIDKYLS